MGSWGKSTARSAKPCRAFSAPRAKIAGRRALSPSQAPETGTGILKSKSEIIGAAEDGFVNDSLRRSRRRQVRSAFRADAKYLIFGISGTARG